MAKFTRFDTRNKKKGKQKDHTLNKINRIRNVEHYERTNQQRVLKEVVYDDENDYSKPVNLNG